MSEEDVELVRAAAGTATNRDMRDPQRVGDIWHPDCEWTSALILDTHTYHGELSEAFAEWGVDSLDAVDAGNGLVVATWWFRALGRGSGIPVENHMGGVFEIDDGRVRRARAFLDFADAYREAGLTPPHAD